MVSCARTATRAATISLSPFRASAATCVRAAGVAAVPAEPVLLAWRRLGCFGGTTRCGNKCVDLQIDPQNCGSCGTPCNGTCFNGMCCSGNTVWCNGACRDWKTDKNHCGGCGIVCAGISNQGVCCGANDILCPRTRSCRRFLRECRPFRSVVAAPGTVTLVARTPIVASIVHRRRLCRARKRSQSSLRRPRRFAGGSSRPLVAK